MHFLALRPYVWQQLQNSPTLRGVDRPRRSFSASTVAPSRIAEDEKQQEPVNEQQSRQGYLLGTRVAASDAREYSPGHCNYLAKLRTGVRVGGVSGKGVIGSLLADTRVKHAAAAAERAMASGAVVHEVQSGAEIASLEYWQQGDASLNTSEALRARFALRSHAGVVEALQLFWQAALRSVTTTTTTTTDQGEAAAAAVHAPALGFEGYSMLLRRVYKALMDEWDEADADKCILDDWRNDAKGKSEIGREGLMDAMFELADQWCETIEAEEYIAFLHTLFGQVAIASPHTGGGGGGSTTPAAGAIGSSGGILRDESAVAFGHHGASAALVSANVPLEAPRDIEDMVPASPSSPHVLAAPSPRRARVRKTKKRQQAAVKIESAARKRIAAKQSRSREQAAAKIGAAAQGHVVRKQKREGRLEERTKREVIIATQQGRKTEPSSTKNANAASNASSSFVSSHLQQQQQRQQQPNPPPPPPSSAPLKTSLYSPASPASPTKWTRPTEHSAEQQPQSSYASLGSKRMPPAPAAAVKQHRKANGRNGNFSFVPGGTPPSPSESRPSARSAAGASTMADGAHAALPKRRSKLVSPHRVWSPLNPSWRLQEDEQHRPLHAWRETATALSHELGHELGMPCSSVRLVSSSGNGGGRAGEATGGSHTAMDKEVRPPSPTPSSTPPMTPLSEERPPPESRKDALHVAAEPGGPNVVVAWDRSQADAPSYSSALATAAAMSASAPASRQASMSVTSSQIAAPRTAAAATIATSAVVGVAPDSHPPVVTLRARRIERRRAAKALRALSGGRPLIRRPHGSSPFGRHVVRPVGAAASRKLAAAAEAGGGERDEGGRERKLSGRRLMPKPALSDMGRRGAAMQDAAVARAEVEAMAMTATMVNGMLGSEETAAEEGEEEEGWWAGAEEYEGGFALMESSDDTGYGMAAWGVPQLLPPGGSFGGGSRGGGRFACGGEDESRGVRSIVPQTTGERSTGRRMGMHGTLPADIIHGEKPRFGGRGGGAGGGTGLASPQPSSRRLAFEASRQKLTSARDDGGARRVSLSAGFPLADAARSLSGMTRGGSALASVPKPHSLGGVTYELRSEIDKTAEMRPSSSQLPQRLPTRVWHRPPSAASLLTHRPDLSLRDGSFASPALRSSSAPAIGYGPLGYLNTVPRATAVVHNLRSLPRRYSRQGEGGEEEGTSRTAGGVGGATVAHPPATQSVSREIPRAALGKGQQPGLTLPAQLLEPSGGRPRPSHAGKSEKEAKSAHPRFERSAFPSPYMKSLSQE